MENLMIATAAVVPFIVYILMGAIAKKAGAVKEDFLKQLNSVAFKVFFPFIMFDNLYDADFSTLNGSFYVPFAVVATLCLIALALLIVPRLEKENARRGVIIQAVFRSNAVLYAIPLVTSVFGDAGAAKASILVAFVVPLYNIVSVIVLEYYRGGRVSAGKMLLNILKNPLIKGAIAGAIFNLLPVTMPVPLVKPIAQLSAMATPLALFVLGGTLHLSDVRKNSRVLAAGSLIKLVFVPAVMAFIMYRLSFDPVELFVVFCTFATPVAAASYPMAAGMGGDADLAGEYVMVTTLLSIVTIFTWILVLKNFGCM
ncbi:MAG: AEC family transporter [Lachnospiraceae bacterium]|nr:AEC family transporter [Lachnospiraceae bacterium]